MNLNKIKYELKELMNPSVFNMCFDLNCRLSKYLSDKLKNDLFHKNFGRNNIDRFHRMTNHIAEEIRNGFK